MIPMSSSVRPDLYSSPNIHETCLFLFVWNDYCSRSIDAYQNESIAIEFTLLISDRFLHDVEFDGFSSLPKTPTK